MKKTIALIVAAGESKRAGGDIPKQYQLLENKSLLRLSIEAFLHHPEISQVKVVINSAHQDFYAEHTKGLDILPAIIGGATRQESVRIGLASLQELSPDLVLIHDAARPNISADVISRVVDALDKAQAVIPALPVYDTLKHIEENIVVGTIERAKLFRAQTPQGFHFNEIYQAHQDCSDLECTDDAAIAENFGLEVKIVAGSEHNYKITTSEDMNDAQLLLAASYETRIGSGFDAHKLLEKENSSVTICGIKIDFSKSLEGHSDADVALHALVDAMLGAIAAGDIGEHFPPSDEKWKGADSSQFLLHAYNLLKEKRGKIVNIDITIICEAPKILPHREKMRNRIAEILSIDASRISVKATTTEKMGFTGRGEGIAAQAVVAVKLPS